MPPASTSRVQAQHHPWFARVWARLSGCIGGDAERGELLCGLSGRVLEIGAGDGRNFAHYPSAVSEIVAIEPEPYLRGHAIDAARRASRHVTVLDARAEALPLADRGLTRP